MYRLDKSNKKLSKLVLSILIARSDSKIPSIFFYYFNSEAKGFVRTRRSVICIVAST
jgi:hypothetical protein